MIAGGFNYHTQRFNVGAGYTRRSTPVSSTSSAYFGNDQYTAGGGVTLGPSKSWAAIRS
jgi:hypothetical protein